MKVEFTKAWCAAKAELEDGDCTVGPKAAQPDCRNCEWIAENDAGHVCLQSVCTNGDKYEAAPKVVLWRTE